MRLLRIWKQEKTRAGLLFSINCQNQDLQVFPPPVGEVCNLAGAECPIHSKLYFNCQNQDLQDSGICRI